MSEICHAVGTVRTMSAACGRGRSQQLAHGTANIEEGARYISWLKIHDSRDWQGAF